MINDNPPLTDESKTTVTNKNKKNVSKKTEGKGKEYGIFDNPGPLNEQSIKDVYLERLNNKILNKINDSSPEDFVNSNS